jgi:hypothetical protein
LPMKLSKLTYLSIFGIFITFDQLEIFNVDWKFYMLSNEHKMLLFSMLIDGNVSSHRIYLN